MATKLARSQRTARGRAPGQGRSLIQVGDLLAGKYRVERILGEGGMGVVVAAYHELLDQHVAVKLLYQDVADREAQSRLLLEARAAAKLQSEHVARVLDVAVGSDGLPFIVMELLEGADLCDIADARGALPRWVVVDYVLQALEALAHAHARGIVHRDLKPSNLFLTDRPDGSQIIKILDFGISKSQEQPGDRRAAQLTGGRAVLGSPPYMSPEQVRSPKNVDHRTDIWSLGICMYELLTNSMPFGGDEIQETFAQILENEPMPLRSLVTGIPEGLEHAVLKCLAKRRDDRWRDVGELAKAIVPYGTGAWIQAPERIAATLARPAIDDPTSGMRLKKHPTTPPSFPVISVPPTPRRLESLQPELTGTANTVARRFTILEPSRRLWLLVAVAVPALVGIVLIFASIAAKARAAHLAHAAGPAPPPSSSTVELAPLDAPEVPAGPVTALALPPGAAATAADTAQAQPSSGPPAKARPASLGQAGRAAPAPPPPAKRPASPSRPALPPGLPLTRQ